MQKASFSDSFESLGSIISRLKEVLEYKKLDQNDFIRDAAIQRFEFTIELFWKVLKKSYSMKK
jgi:phage-related protein